MLGHVMNMLKLVDCLIFRRNIIDDRLLKHVSLDWLLTSTKSEVSDELESDERFNSTTGGLIARESSRIKDGELL